MSKEKFAWKVKTYFLEKIRKKNKKKKHLKMLSTEMALS